MANKTEHIKLSRIGRHPVKLPAGVTATVSNDQVVTVKGPQGELSQKVDACIKVELHDGEIALLCDTNDKEVKSKHGLYRALIQNMVTGVVQPFTKSLILKGVGYKAVKQGNKVVFTVGYSHTVDFVEPQGIKLEVVNPNEVKVIGIDKTQVGQVAANIREIRKPEPYHGYGIRYADEVIVMKVGKTGK